MFIGRTRELQELSAEITDWNMGTAVLVYGKRRVGKSTLIREAAGNFDGIVINHLCVQSTFEGNLDLIYRSVSAGLSLPDMKFDSLFAMMDFLRTLDKKILLIIDEYAEFKRGTDEDLDRMLIEMAKFSKATGIHLIVATQGARSEFLSKELKEAIPARACLAVADKRESNIVMKKTGADRLAGDGDMIITANEEDPGLFLQAAYATDEEIDRVAGFLRNEKLYV